MSKIVVLCLICASAVAQQSTDQKASPASAAQMSNLIRVDPVSVESLLLLLMSKGQILGSATGFVVQKNGISYLVTNWHVVTDRRPDNGAAMDPQGRYPDEIQILQNEKDHLGRWVLKTEKLVNEKNEALWIEHPAGRAVDVVFLRLTNLSDVQLYPVDLELRKTQITLLPTSPVSIVGFPFGQGQTPGLPIWKTGTVASDPDVDYGNAPQMLVDCTARPGMSGSPVYARRIGPYSEGTGLILSTKPTTDRFIGIFAGDIDGKSEIDRIWKASAIMTIYDSLP